jgi:hypothetical protein
VERGVCSKSSTTLYGLGYQINLEEEETLMEDHFDELIEDHFDNIAYEPPMLVEVGGFAQLTRGGAWFGLDNFWQTQW